MLYSRKIAECQQKQQHCCSQRFEGFLTGNSALNMSLRLNIEGASLRLVAPPLHDPSGPSVNGHAEEIQPGRRLIPQVPCRAQHSAEPFRLDMGPMPILWVVWPGGNDNNSRAEYIAVNIGSTWFNSAITTIHWCVVEQQKKLCGSSSSCDMFDMRIESAIGF